MPTANRFFEGKLLPGRGIPDIAWHGARVDPPAWHDGQGRFLRFTIAGLTDDEEDLHVILNMSDQTVEAALPSIAGRRWHVALDSFRAPPADVLASGGQRPHAAAHYSAQARSVIVPEARP